MAEPWRHCSRCKRPIELGGTYLVCSVSTCNRARTGLVFCSMECWDAHLPMARHREAHAEELTAPRTRDEAEAPKRSRATSGARRRVAPTRKRDPSLPSDPLIIAQNLKRYVKAAGSMNTSDRVMDVLAERVRDLCDRAISKAAADGRKTILDRDLDP